MRMNGTVYSQVLGIDTGISVVTPSHLDSKKPYRIAYLLHGLYANHQMWTDYTLLPHYAEEGNTIYIMPDMGRSFYTDMKYGGRYYTYLTEELPEICRHLFRISSSRENTIIMGGSMGGFGALKCALNKPEQYGICCAFSSGFLFFNELLTEIKLHGMSQEYKTHFGPQMEQDFTLIFGETLELLPENDLLALASKAAGSGLFPDLYLTCGTEDILYPDHLSFTKELSNRQIPYAFESWKGGHDYGYFSQALQKAITRFHL